MPIEAPVTLRSEQVAGRRPRAHPAARGRGARRQHHGRRQGRRPDLQGGLGRARRHGEPFRPPLLETRDRRPRRRRRRLTPAGIRVIEAFGRLEAEMSRVRRGARAAACRQRRLPFNLVSGFLMRTSARNALRGTVSAIRSDALTAEVAVAMSRRRRPSTRSSRSESLRELGLVVGREAIVLIKASFVLIAPGDRHRSLSAAIACAALSSAATSRPSTPKCVLDIGGGRTLAATITAHSADELGLAPGRPACALSTPPTSSSPSTDQSETDS